MAIIGREGDRHRLRATSLSRRSHDVEQDLYKTLTALRAYRRRDSSFKAAIATAAKAEAKYSQSDPLDGAIVIGELVDGRVAPQTGPVAAEIHQLLHG